MCFRAVSEHRELAVADLDSQGLANQRVFAERRFARTVFLARIVLIYESVVEAVNAGTPRRRRQAAIIPWES